MIDAPHQLDTVSDRPRDSRLRRLCARLGGWCGWLVDTHHARIPF